MLGKQIRLLVAWVTLLCGHMHGFTEKTYLAFQPLRSNFEQRYGAWQEFIERERRDECGGRIELEMFYKASTNKAQLGRYFGVNDKNNIAIGKRFVGPDLNAVDPLSCADVDLRYFIHNFLLDNRKVQLRITPEQTMFGLQMFYFQSLDAMCKNVFLQIDLPVLFIENNLNALFTPSGYLPNQNPNEVMEYFQGTVEDEHQDQLLSAARINGKKKTSGLSDMTCKVGYYLLNKLDKHVSISLVSTIPLGNKPKGAFLFEPIRGSGGHFGLGFDVAGDMLLWDNFDTNVQIISRVGYRYLFETDQRRTLGIKGRRFGQYYLLGQNGQKQLIPAANVLTKPLSVSGLSQLEGVVGLNVNSYSWNIGCSYSLLAIEPEEVTLKGCWPEQTYGVASFGFEGFAGAFGTRPSNFDSGRMNDWIRSQDLDRQAAETPGHTTHRLQLAGSKFFDCSNQTFLVTMGLGYEFSNRNNNWAGWDTSAGVGISF